MQRLVNAGLRLPRVGLCHSVLLGRACPGRPMSTSLCRRAGSIADKSASSSSTTASLQAQILRQRQEAYRQRNRSLLMYSAAAFIFGIGITYAAVPLYRAFCSATGFSGTPMVGLGRFQPSQLFPQYFDQSTNSATRRIRVTFNADHSDSLPWTFRPSQEEIFVLPGETALAFYKAKNKGDRDITGIATYNVSPDRVSEAGGNEWQWANRRASPRLRRTLPRLNASASRSSGCLPTRTSTYPSSSSSTRMCSTIQMCATSRMLCSVTASLVREETRRVGSWSPTQTSKR